MKFCTKCLTEKSKSSFGISNGAKDGLNYWCKECNRKSSVNVASRNRNLHIESDTNIHINNKKVCGKCNEEKDIDCFSVRLSTKDGLRFSCKSCDKIIRREEYLRNTDNNIARQVNYRAKNPDKVKKCGRASYNKHVEKRRASASVYRKENPDVVNINNQNRRARKKGNGGKLSPGLKKKLFKLQRGHCAICKIKLSNAPRQQHMDHVIALANGGPNEDWNMQLLCQPCNLEKHTKDNLEFMQSKGYLL